jgi:hypothetical protein
MLADLLEEGGWPESQYGNRTFANRYMSVLVARKDEVVNPQGIDGRARVR